MFHRQPRDNSYHIEAAGVRPDLMWRSRAFSLGQRGAKGELGSKWYQ